MSDIVTAAAAEKLSFGETDPEKAALQQVAMVLATRKGSVPMYREFGFDWSVLDKPASIAEPLARAAIREAVERWCGGVTVKNISFQRDDRTGTLIPAVEVEIHAGT